MSQASVDVANAYYSAIHAGDFDRLFEVLSDDCVIEFYGPAVIPFAGYFRGKDKCRIFFGHVANDVNIKHFSQDEFIASGDQVAVVGRLTLEFKDTGRIYDSPYAHILTIGNGQVTRFRDFQNSALAASVCTVVETPEH